MCKLVEASPSAVDVLGKRTVLAAALEISPSFPYRVPVHGILFLADGDACGSFLQTCRGLAKRSRCAWQKEGACSSLGDFAKLSVSSSCSWDLVLSIR
jgi:hypothetical protein